MCPQAALILFWGFSAEAVFLHNCGGSSDDTFAEVVRGSTNTTFTCSMNRTDSANTIEWKVNKYAVATCNSPTSPTSNADMCVGKGHEQVFNAKRRSALQSVMTINTSHLTSDNVVASGTLFCKNVNNSKEDSCPIDYIIKADGTCTTQVVNSSSPWNITSSCSITKGNSSRVRYACQWSSRKTPDKNDSWTSNWIKMMSNTLPGGEAHCSLALPLPVEDGHYAYKVKLIPGRQVVEAGGITLKQPSTPSITCQTTPVQENSSVVCTCIENMGRPPGRLRWVKALNNSFNTGENLTTGDSPLRLSHQLTPADQNVAKFACKVMWFDKVKTSNIYTAVIGPAIGKSASDGAFIAAGIVVAVGVVAVIIIVIVIICKRKRTMDKPENGTQTLVDDDFYRADVSHENTCRSSDATPPMNIPPCEQPSTSAAANTNTQGTGFEYAPVNKPDKNASAMIANVNPSNAKYAVVNKTKKTPKPPLMDANEAGTSDENAVAVEPMKHMPTPDANSTNPADEYTAVIKKTKAKDGKPTSKPKYATSKPMQNKGKEKGTICGYVDINLPKSKTAKQPDSGPREGEQEGRSINQDGLIYVGVDVSGSSKSPSTASKPPDSDQRVVYSPIDFSRSK